MGFEYFKKFFAPDLANLNAEKRFSEANKHLSAAENAEAKSTLKEAARIANLSNYADEAEKLHLPETRELRLKDGTAWLNLVLTLISKQPSILTQEPDLRGEVRVVLAKEKENRATMPLAKQKILDAAIYDIEKKDLFNAAIPKENIPATSREEKLDKAA